MRIIEVGGSGGHFVLQDRENSMVCGTGCTERSEEASVIQSTVGTDRRADEGVARHVLEVAPATCSPSRYAKQSSTVHCMVVQCSAIYYSTEVTYICPRGDSLDSALKAQLRVENPFGAHMPLLDAGHETRNQ